MAQDTTVVAELDQIAAKLETKAGIEPDALARDPEIVAKLRRIRVAIDDFTAAIEEHALSDHTDVAALTPANGDFLRYLSGLWTSDVVGLGDLANVESTANTGTTVPTFLYSSGGPNWTVETALSSILIDFYNTTVPTPTTDSVLKYDPTLGGGAGGWHPDFVALDELSDTDIVSPAMGEYLYWNGTEWANGFGVGVLLADGSVPLTGAWDAGDFGITADNFYADEDTLASFNAFAQTYITTSTAGSEGNVVRGVYIDQNQTYNNAAGIYAGTLIGIDIDLDFVHTASFFQFPVFKILRGDLNYGAFTPTSPAVDINVTGTAAGATFGNAMAVFAFTSAANTIRALRSEANGSSTGAGATDVCTGYQGFGNGASAYTGNVIGVHGFTSGTHSGCRGTWGLFGQPDAFGSGIANNRTVAVGGFGGHFFANGGSGIFVDSTGAAFGRPVDVTPTHLDFNANTGELYVENAAEIDGTLYCDGDFDHNGTNFGVFGAAPAPQTAAYTPTNVTTDRSFDADTVAVAELADVVGTLIADLQTFGFLA